MNAALFFPAVRVKSVWTLLGCLLLAGSLHAQMNWTFQDVPYLDEWNSQISYNSATRLLTITGDATDVSLGGAEPFYYVYGSTPTQLVDPSTPLGWRNFSLSATIDHNGQLSPGGSFTITGFVYDSAPGLPTRSGTLLTGSISGFEFVSFPTKDGAKTGLSSDFGFKFQPTGGDLASLYGGAEGGFALYFINHTDGSPVGFAGDFTQSFTDNSGGAFGTVAPIPEPSTYTAILGGLTLLGAILRRRRAAVLHWQTGGRQA